MKSSQIKGIRSAARGIISEFVQGERARARAYDEFMWKKGSSNETPAEREEIARVLSRFAINLAFAPHFK
jgi:hypothetical protein